MRHQSRKQSSAELLDLAFGHLIRRLSGFDVDYDAEIIKSFSETTQIPKQMILAQMQAHCRPGTRTLQ